MGGARHWDKHDTLANAAFASTVPRGRTQLVYRDDPSQLLVEESELLLAAQQGNRQAFAKLVDRYWDRLYRWLYHLTGDQHLAEDLAQETFLKAFAGLRLFRLGSNFRAWLFRIAHNCFVSMHRGTGKKCQSYPDHLPSNGEGPVEQTLSREAMHLLRQAVDRLPPDLRAAFLLRAEEEMSFRQIAQVLGLTEVTARWRVFKARQKLLTALAAQLDGELT